MSLKEKILGTELAPTKLRSLLKAVRYTPMMIGNEVYDLTRYYRYSASFGYDSREALRARITAMYHNTEKGLSLREPRPWFGSDNIVYLVEAIRIYVKRYGVDESLAPAAGALRTYLEVNEKHPIGKFAHRQKIIDTLELLRDVNSPERGGLAYITSESVRAAVANVDESFFLTRHTVRQFTDEEVSQEDIEAVIRMAQRTPAVCNRQNSFVHVIHDKALIRKALDFHTGAKGFSDQVNKLFVVTNRLTSFWGSGERNQVWIDGGMFAMSLVLALHSRGLGSCCLNWSKVAETDRKFREFVAIPEDESIIMLMAVGHIPEKLQVARSTRRPVEEAYRFLN